MPVNDNELDLIFRYIDGDLSAEEEQQLQQQLQQNVELQQTFDQQILMHQFQPDELVAPVVSTATESADDFLRRVTGSMEASQSPEMVRPIPAVKRSKTWMAAAAAILVCILAISIYFINREKKDNPVVKLPGKDSVAQINKPSPKQLQNEPVPAPAVDMQQLYADNNGIFSSTNLNIPPEAAMYESDYKHGNYQKLATLPESTLETKGSGDPDEKAEIADYFYFYKALASIQVSDTTTAKKLLKKLLNSNAGKSKLGDPIKWYLLMTYLKSNNKAAALAMADRLTKDRKNAYYKQAFEIKEKLSR